MNFEYSSPYLFYDGVYYSGRPKRFSLDNGVGGWFFIRIASLVSLSEIEVLNNDYQMHFSTENMVSKGWFHAFMNETQYNFLNSQQKYEIYPQEKPISKRSNSIDLKSEFLVQATENWHPTNNKTKSQHISKNIYVVSNLESLSILNNDYRVASYKPLVKREALNRYEVPVLLNGETQTPEPNGVPLGSRKLYNFGLDGTNQIINIVDSGIDEYHCFFYDSKYTISINSTNLKHRKVVRIDEWVDTQDAEDGHGTHVGASIAGYPDCEDCGIKLYSGVAKGAKLYVTDIGISSIKSDVSGNYDLDQTTQTMKQLDSGVSCNSWGYSAEVGQIEYSYNLEAEKNPEIAFVFAAGNSRDPLTVTVPSISKNVITVGLSSNAPSYSMEINEGNISLSDPQGLRIPLTQSSNTDYFKMTAGTPMTWLSNLSVVDYADDADFQGKIVKTSNNLDDISNSLERGAKAVISVTKNELKTQKSPVFFSSEDFNVDQGSILLESYSNKEFEVSYIESRGPASNGLLKPDVVAPGHPLKSARAGDPENQTRRECTIDTISRKQGTSMATPLIAGLCGIIRQYFVEGWYKDSKKNSAEKVVPSSALMKNVLVAAAYPIGSITPNFNAGFGIPVLSNVINPENPDIKMLFVDYMNVSSSEHYKTTIKVTKEGRLSIAMSYLDATLENYVAPLFADLDLFVIDPDGYVIVGNQFNSSATEQFSNTERVLIHAKPGNYEIHITSNEYTIQRSVHTSVFVSGFVDNSKSHALQFEKVTECISKCDNKGTCSKNGICQCSDGYYGYKCQQKAISINYNSGKNYTIPPREPTVMYFSSNALAFRSSISFTVNDYKKKPRDLICFSSKVPKGIASADQCFIAENETTMNFHGSIFSSAAKNVYIYVYQMSQQPATMYLAVSAPTGLVLFRDIIIPFLIVLIIIMIIIVAIVVYFRRRKTKIEEIAEKLDDNTKMNEDTQIAIDV
ncbi:Clan SB, family S8, subtilisin-like serine peptidase [Trichomonas vaginalis G3]|uniref:Clan SB, family S8, subtilisin-like serine peptidase n=1 Tax=Trichomonas vaginalis (strain ATCC PRA-98 / G3) TaxID=412133 RepID=A2E7K1_TRIV3|nr:proprotein convertase-related family [Trichomonas vaginalis G3]EAY11394.1 Clan SB, family S8, subtilisin-like serine peptidase [Trichomonas vaginalis G3]KAI5530559.1 proprotein convertase-related family [Trichomonas vaginalis G3]|eukprot:XP_001323617.1 Clan SB, family S8, subtilisin-like serine peptidase [Trichomonas vaginalis G3]